MVRSESSPDHNSLTLLVHTSLLEVDCRLESVNSSYKDASFVSAIKFEIQKLFEIATMI